MSQSWGGINTIGGTRPDESSIDVELDALWIDGPTHDCADHQMDRARSRACREPDAPQSPRSRAQVVQTGGFAQELVLPLLAKHSVGLPHD
jgi:hypothetical protein